ncbi:heat-inducible transcriptional repressor HrcA [Peptococcaceae bacterium 1198_IL3148]
MKMDDRKKKILLAIIQDYISTAEPVGSRTISRKYNLGVSPATIRNEMADLEDLGLIEQPHTSAGRIPSDLGYRYYVDYLMEPEKLSVEQMQFINSSYKDKAQELGKVINRTGQLLSDLTNYTSIVTSPQMSQAQIKYVQLVSMAPTLAMVIIVLNSGAVYHHQIEVAESITQQDLEQISRVLNAKLSGVNMENIKLTLLNEIYLELSRYRDFVDVALELMQNNLAKQVEGKIYLGGVYNILNQPEFHNIEKLKTLLSLLEKESLLQDIMMGKKDGLSVRIGVENNQEEIKDCTMITATYKIGNHMQGTIGVLGPTRMEYSKAITIVEHLSKILNYTLEKLNRG